MKNNSKERLFEMMSKIDPTFKKNYILENIKLDDYLTLDQNDLNEILKGYIDAALWTEEERLMDDVKGYNNTVSTDYDDESDESESELKLLKILRNKLNTNIITKFTKDHIDYDSLIQSYVDIKNFIKNAGSDGIIEAIEDNGNYQLGVDFWLTRNGHGSGFFNHSYQFEDDLMNAARKSKEIYVELGDDNKLYFR
jgi:hypothetical protein